MTSDDTDVTRTDDLAGRLTDLLTRSADAVDVRPDLDAVVDAPTVISLVDDERLAGAASRRDVGLQPARRLALGAIAAAAVVALVAAALAVREDDPAQPVASGRGTTTTTPPVDAPTAAVYPVVDSWPEGFAVQDAVLQDIGMGAEPGPTAVIGTTEGDAVVGGITVQAFRGPSSVLERAETTPITVGGRAALTLEGYGHAGEARSPSLLLRDGDVLLVISGDDPVAFVEAVPDAVTARIDGDGVDLVIGDLPAPYELLRGPTDPPDARTWPSLDAGSDLSGNPPPFVFVEVRSGDPLEAVVGPSGTARPIDVSEHQGWIAEGEGVDPDALGSTYVAWAPAEGITVSVSGAVDRETALAVAREVRLVDRAEWEATYGDVLTDLTDPAGEDETTTTPPTTGETDVGCADEQPGGTVACTQVATGEWLTEHPLLGQPLPPMVVDGEDVPLPTGPGSVVVLGGPWCVPCVGQLADLDALWRERPAAQAHGIAFVAVGTDEEEVEDLRRDQAAGWVGHLADWGVIDRWQLPGAVPVTLVVDPAGVVRAIALGRVDALTVYGTLLGTAAESPTTTTAATDPSNPYCSYPDRVTGRTTC